mgnify:CR=1 FL=1
MKVRVRVRVSGSSAVVVLKVKMERMAVRGGERTVTAIMISVLMIMILPMMLMLTSADSGTTEAMEQSHLDESLKGNGSSDNSASVHVGSARRNNNTTTHTDFVFASLLLTNLYWSETMVDREAELIVKIPLFNNSHNDDTDNYNAILQTHAERFIKLCATEYFDGNRFFRVAPEYIAQFGVNDNPKWTDSWMKHPLQAPDSNRDDDNKAFTIGFARESSLTSGLQVFINLRDNSQLFMENQYGKGIVTFGRIVNKDGRKKLKGLFPAEVCALIYCHYEVVMSKMYIFLGRPE